MDRTEYLTFATLVYKARLANDASAMASHFARDGYFEMIGSPDTAPVAKGRGMTQLLTLMQYLVSVWKWEDQQFRVVTVDGHDASFMYEVRATHIPSGRQVVTMVNDIWTVQNEKIKSLYEFVDTALIASLADGG